MTHPHADELLSFATGELDELRVAQIAAHVAECASCRGAVAQIDESLIALDVAWPRRSRTLARPAVWAGFALTAAATLAAVLIRQPADPRPAAEAWMPRTTWSATAGYMAGGKALLDIDAQLTRLEQESYYARP